MPFVSIIIPVYNVEKYLRQCVDSVLEQKLDNIELILVDDGSPDNCPQICDEYAVNHHEIRVVHKKNGGLSSARNAGIAAATGEYLMFMDSDDWWNKDVSVKNIFDTVKNTPNVEMFLFTSYDYIEGQGFFKRDEHNNLKNIRTDTVEHYYQDLINNGNLEVSACTKILKKSFIEKNALYFKEGLLSEDNHWMIKLLRKLQSVSVIDEPLYLCRTDRQDSITHTIKKKNISDLLTIIGETIEYFHSKNAKENIKKLEMCYGSYLWFSALGLSSTLSKVEKKELKSIFKLTKEVCSYSNSKKTKLCNVCLKIAGFNLTTAILGYYIKLKGKHTLNRTSVNSD